ncbi:MAG: esterase-like activity of phytase family protein [Bacteroidota bacterium]
MKNFSLLLFFVLFLFSKTDHLQAQAITLEPLSTYYTDIFDEGAAEIVAHDPVSQRLYFTNADDNSIVALDISNPQQPVEAFKIDMSPYGDGVNSVAVAAQRVAVAVEADPKQEPGKVVLFDADGGLLREYPAGALPDMVLFTADGSKILVANEGEPDDDYQVDPEGSVTVIDLTEGVDAPRFTQITFEAFNDQKASLQNKGVRIFGPNANVAQDLEPEYIALSPDESTAYVACQENNALIVIDMATLEIADIVALGYKDHMNGQPLMGTFQLQDIPTWIDLGTPLYGGETVRLGGFSGLWYDQAGSNPATQVFYTIPDRGPNESTVSRSLAGTSQNLRPFKLPDYQARIVKFTWSNSTGRLEFDPDEQIFLTAKDGQTPISGRGNIPGFDEVPVTQTDATVYTRADFSINGTDYQQLEYDRFGGDFEGIVKAPNGDFWMCDEYRPAIYHFRPNGQLIERYVPEGTSQLGDVAQPAGFYGEESLPAVYSKRRANRGFEALALDSDEGILYAFIQTPLYNPDASTRNQSDVIRVLGIDPATGQPVREYVYLLEANRNAGAGLSRVDKIGDAVYKGDGKFLILERDSSNPDDGRTGKKYVFEFTLKGATNILGTALSEKSTSTGPSDKTLEMMTADELVAMGIRPLHKRKVLNLPTINYLPSDKPEGLSILPDGRILVLNDNDFGLAGAGVSDQSMLGVITLTKNYGFDASNRDDDIKIWQRQSLGMFQPDAITSYAINGDNYVLTANEGDGRDYDGYSEEERFGGVDVDFGAFPNAGYIQQNEVMGRLKMTSSQGDLDGDGLFDEVYSFGARSFSIWDAFGNLVWDSGDQFEKILLWFHPETFNANNDDNDSRKSRSDDKGPEPEAIAVTEYGGRQYALIGLERVGGIMVYDITNPYEPYFVNYFNNRNFDEDAESREAGDLGVEDIKVIAPQDNPTGFPLVVTANEVSGTVTLFQMKSPFINPFNNGPASRTVSNGVGTLAQLQASPNPFVDQVDIRYQLAEDSQVAIDLYDLEGRQLATVWQGHQLAGPQQITYSEGLKNLPAGIYFLKVQLGEQVETLPLVKK